MTTVLTDSANYTAIANAIRSKLGVQTTYTPSEMAGAIGEISGGGSDLGTKTITTNGTYNASDDNFDGYSQVIVNVPASSVMLKPPAPTNIAVVAGNAQATITWQDGEDGLYYGEPVAIWDRTVIVRKANSAPSSISDGTVVVTSTVANQYSSSGYTDTGLTNGTTYYYAAFAVSSDGVTSTAATASGQPTAFDPSSVSWATSSWDDIAMLLDKHYAGELDIANYWSVGDTRSVSLSAMAATGVNESHVAQTVEWVIADFDKIPLTTARGTRTKAAVVFTQKNFLANGTSGEWGYMNSSNTNSGGWDSCARRTWCNNVYKSALPSGLQGLLKQVNIVTASGSSSDTATSADYIFLPAEKEVFGTAAKYANATAEASLSQWEYFETQANRVKKAGASGSAYYWWERSPFSGYSDSFCGVYSGGTANYSSASSGFGVAPSGCI